MNLLNLNKNDTLDLTKKEPELNNIVLACGWDVAKKGLFSFGVSDIDLDLSAFLLNENYKLIGQEGFIYFNNQRGKGIYLHNDNRTGQGEGDDETISIDLSLIDSSIQKIVFVVSIHEAQSKRQTFGMINNSYVRLVDTLNNKELCRFNLKSDGSTATSVIFANLYRESGEWQFKAIGEGKIADLNGVLALFS